jgi:Glycosyltransferase family 25 (LPS biosynthesis protein)
VLVDTLDYSFATDVEKAYVITVKGNETSERLARRCLESCYRVGMPAQPWEAFDGTGDSIVYPSHAEGQDHYRFIKQMNTFLKRGEAAAILSHYSLWCRCVALDRPIVVLEHDAVMVKAYRAHNGFNQIGYLGNLQQLEEGRYPDFPPHSAASKNHLFICRAHAYAIDPMVARSLVSHLIRYGMGAPADMMIRADLFNIVQPGFYAFDAPEETTITGRDPHWQEDAREIFSTFT